MTLTNSAINIIDSLAPTLKVIVVFLIGIGCSMLVQIVLYLIGKCRGVKHDTEN